MGRVLVLLLVLTLMLVLMLCTTWLALVNLLAGRPWLILFYAAVTMLTMTGAAYLVAIQGRPPHE